MNYDFEQTNFSRCVLAGLLAGFTAVILNIIFFFFIGSDEVGSHYSVIINPFTIFFGGIIPAVLGGVIYSFLSERKGGAISYVIIFSILTVLFAKISFQIHRTDDQNVERLFHQILLCMIIIGGVFTTFLVPIITRNKKIQRVFF